MSSVRKTAKKERKQQCIGAKCGELIPETGLFTAERCEKECLEGSNLCLTCSKAEAALMAGKKKVTDTTYQGRMGAVLPESRIKTAAAARRVTAKKNATANIRKATDAAETAAAAASYLSNAAAAVSEFGGPVVAEIKESAKKAEKAAKVAVARAKTAAEIEADALKAQLKAVRERAAAERAEAAAIAKAQREAEMAIKKAAKEAEEAAKKATTEVKKAEKKTETVLKTKTRKATSIRRTSANRASGSASPLRNSVRVRSGYATPYSGSPGSNSFRYNLVRMPRPPKLNTAGGSTGVGAVARKNTSERRSGANAVAVRTNAVGAPNYADFEDMFQ